MFIFMLLGLLIVVGSAMWAIGISFQGGEVSIAESSEKKKNVVLKIVIGIILGYAIASLVVIGPGDAGAVFNIFTGVQSRNLASGMHIVPLIINRVEIYDIYTKTYTEEINCLSKDGLSMTMDVSIRFRLNGNVSEVFRHVGTERDVEEKILIPTARSKMRDVTAEFTAQEAYALKRMELQARYEDLLTKFFGSENYIIPEQILIRKVTPPEELTAKITESKVSEQEVVNQQNVLTSVKIKKDQAITEAQGQAEALRIRGQSITANPKVAMLEWINKWNGILPVYMMGQGSAVMFNLGDMQK